ETGQSYDLAIAERLFRDAVEDLLDYASGFVFDQIVIPVGNDFLHFDNFRNQTSNGTPLDVDGRFPKVFVAGEMSMIWAVELLRGVAPVKLIWVRGNHDTISSFCLARVLLNRFHNADDVEVDCSPTKHKYIRYGKNLLGFTHGDKIKLDK